MDQDNQHELFRERQLLQGKASRVRAQSQSPTSKREKVRESVTAVKQKLKNIKTLAADSKNSVDMPPDSSPEGNSCRNGNMPFFMVKCENTGFSIIAKYYSIGVSF